MNALCSRLMQRSKWMQLLLLSVALIVARGAYAQQEPPTPRAGDAATSAEPNAQPEPSVQPETAPTTQEAATTEEAATNEPAVEEPAVDVPRVDPVAKAEPPVDVKDAATLESIIMKLSPENRQKFGEMLATDWKDRPEWTDMLIVLLKGVDMRPGQGWFKPSENKYGWSWLSARLDTSADGIVSITELPANAPYKDLIFSRLDRNNDGQLQLADFDHFSRQQSTPPQMMSQFLTSILDKDSNGRITPEELNNFLAKADKDQTGFITSEDLFGQFSRAFADQGRGGDGMPGPETMLSMFFNGELGVWEKGPEIGEEAPDFTLPTHDGSQTFTLSKSRGRPVVLIFGSFT